MDIHRHRFAFTHPPCVHTSRSTGSHANIIVVSLCAILEHSQCLSWWWILVLRLFQIFVCPYGNPAWTTLRQTIGSSSSPATLNGAESVYDSVRKGGREGLSDTPFTPEFFNKNVLHLASLRQSHLRVIAGESFSNTMGLSENRSVGRDNYEHLKASDPDLKCDGFQSVFGWWLTFWLYSSFHFELLFCCQPATTSMSNHITIQDNQYVS
jgi:hypothetical protein